MLDVATFGRTVLYGGRLVLYHDWTVDASFGEVAGRSMVPSAQVVPVGSRAAQNEQICDLGFSAFRTCSLEAVEAVGIAIFQPAGGLP